MAIEAAFVGAMGLGSGFPQRFVENVTSPIFVVGFVGQMIFTSRFIIQWISSERHKKSHIPVYFWYASIAGSFLTLIYGIAVAEPVIIFGQWGFFIYIRNLWFVYRHESSGEKTKELRRLAVIFSLVLLFVFGYIGLVTSLKRGWKRELLRTPNRIVLEYRDRTYEIERPSDVAEVVEYMLDLAPSARRISYDPQGSIRMLAVDGKVMAEMPFCEVFFRADGSDYVFDGDGWEKIMRKARPVAKKLNE